MVGRSFCRSRSEVECWCRRMAEAQLEQTHAAGSCPPPSSLVCPGPACRLRHAHEMSRRKFPRAYVDAGPRSLPGSLCHPDGYNGPRIVLLASAHVSLAKARILRAKLATMCLPTPYDIVVGMLRCASSILARPTSAMGHVWTAPD